jgi:hypothetical protein
MAKAILMEEFHLTVLAPRGLKDAAYDAIRRTLDGRRFQADLRRAVRAVVGQQSSLAKVRVAVTR